MSQQLELLKVGGNGASGTPSPSARAERPAPTSAPKPPPATKPEGQVEPEAYVPYRPIESGKGDLSGRQSRHLSGLIERLSRRTGRSKRLAQQHRAELADNRSTAGFRQMWKELVYPLVAERAEGSRVWDADGNEYVDISMGYGSLLYGHSPSFLVEALRGQSGRGLQIGLQSPLAGASARLVREMTGCERTYFVNSGSEAVLTALRLARLRTGRHRVALFRGSYHGFFDEALVLPARGADGRPASLPMAPGVVPHVAETMVALEYCSQESLRLLESCAGDLAAVLVEPQQSRRPGSFDTGEFLRELRRISAQAGAALIFDEVITGFRLHPGGAQAIYGVQADLVTYGKAAGGGVPVGLVSGKAEYMDGVDGGMWQYGDRSFPRQETTFLAGTFFKHPLVMSAVHASLRHLKERSPGLQRGLTRMTSRLVDRLDALFERQRAPIRVMQLGSLFVFHFGPQVRYPDLFFYHLLEEGVYVWEGRALYLSTAHTEEDLDRVVEAAKAALEAMRQGGFLPDPAHKLRLPAALKSRPLLEEDDATARIVPLTPVQHWFFDLELPARQHWNQALALESEQPLDPVRTARAVRLLTRRHAALQCRFRQGSEGWSQVLEPEGAEEPFCCIDLSPLGPDRVERAAAQLADLLQASLNLQRGPIWRAALLQTGTRPASRLLLVAHHLAVDTSSWRILTQEMSVACQAPSALPPSTTSFADWAQRLSRHAGSEEVRQELDYWLEQQRSSAPSLPVDFPQGIPAVASAATVTVRLSEAETQALERQAVRHWSAQLSEMLLTAAVTTLSEWTGSPTVLIDLEGHGREDLFDDVDLSRTVGWFTALYPFQVDLSGQAGQDLSAIKSKMRKVPNGGIGWGLLRYLARQDRLIELPAAQVAFDYSGRTDRPSRPTADASPTGRSTQAAARLRPCAAPVGLCRHPAGPEPYLIEVKGEISANRLAISWHYCKAVHKQQTIEGLARQCADCLRGFARAATGKQS